MAPAKSLLARPRQMGAVPYKRRGLIYFVCGNPGLIGFYDVFLDCLRAMLDASGADGGTAYDIYGRNLLGFSDDDHEPFGKGGQPWDLDGQIEGIYQDVAARRVIVDEEGTGGEGAKERPYDFVILMGHSVGSYISVEIFHRHMKNPERAPHLNLRHGFLLFPTLTHIGLSPSGKKMSRLRYVPTLEANAHVLAQFILGFFSLAMLQWIITNIMGFTPQTADVTARWLKSRDGVWQALHLGVSELGTICEEKWEEELWEVMAEDDEQTQEGANANGFIGDAKALQGQTPKFFMFYGKQDHWVANHLRDAFIDKRREHGERGGRTRIAIDEGDIPHAFCIQEHTSWVIAKKVYEWVEEIEVGR